MRDLLCCGCANSKAKRKTESRRHGEAMTERKDGIVSIELREACKSPIEDLPSPIPSSSSRHGIFGHIPLPDELSVISETDREMLETDELSIMTEGNQVADGLPVVSTSGSVRNKTRTLSATFSEQFDTQENEKTWKGMVKSHYVDKKLRDKCVGCSKTFKLQRRSRHCRRCGELFCNDCLKYKRRLNKLAHPDPGGEPRKVCLSCYNEDSQGHGHARSLTSDFVKEREMCKNVRTLNQRANSKTQTFWRDQLDIPKECKRLIDGFQRSVGQSESKKTMQELQSIMAVPQWQKSKFWQVENVAQHCRQCKRSLGVRKTKRNCKVCSLALCKKCSHKELLIFYDNDSLGEPKCARLALINTIGSPEKEPNISLLLYVCAECRGYIHEKQLDNHTWYESLRDDSPLDEISTMNTMFMTLTNRISASLKKFDEDDYAETHAKEGSNELALLDLQLNEFYTLFKSLKGVLEKAESKTQHKFIKHFTQGQYTFYMEARHGYRKLCKEDRLRHP